MPRQLIRNNYTSCARFDGTSTQITSGANTGITGSTAFTIAAYVFLAGNPTNAIIATIGTTNTSASAIFQINSGGVLDLGLYGIADYTATGISIARGQWYELVFTYAGGAGGAIQHYINGVPTAMSAGTMTANLQNSKLFIGQFNGSGYFPGLIQDGRLWSGVCLTQAQVKAMYYAYVVPTSGLARRYILNDGAGTAPVDSSATGDTSTSTALTWSTYTAFKKRSAVPTPRQPVAGPPGVTTIVQGDGTSNSVVTTGASASLATVSAVSLWFNAPKYSDSCAFFLSDGTTSNCFEVRPLSATQIFLYVYRGGSQILNVNFTPPGLQRWHLICVTVSNGGYNVWLDGAVVLSNSTDTHLTLGSTPTFLFCGAATASLYSICQFSLPGLYTSLNQSQVNQLVAGASPRAIATLVEGWEGKVAAGATSWPGITGLAATFGSTTKLVINKRSKIPSARSAVPT